MIAFRPRGVWSLALWFALGGGCFGPETEEGKAERRPEGEDPLSNGNGAWQVDSTKSPTGTTIVGADELQGQRAEGRAGYAIVDEVCGGDRMSSAYPGRFETPLFRDISAAGADLWLVDGSHAWHLRRSTENGEYLRIGLHVLPGHPISVRVVGARLFVASVDAGLLVYWLTPAGELDSQRAPDVLFDSDDARVMDVDGANRAVYAALGADGVGIVALDADGSVVATSVYPAGPFAAAVQATERGAMVASCARVHEILAPPAGSFESSAQWCDGHELGFNAPVPFGAAKGVAVRDRELYIAAGPALQAFELPSKKGELPRYLGHYTDDVPGFWVNGVATFGDQVYIAAGDESVRALSAENFSTAGPVDITWEGPDAQLNSPAAVALAEAENAGLPRVTSAVVWWEPEDPIQVAVFNHTLYALGNFRWVGERTLFAFDLTLPASPVPVPGYVQPNVLRDAFEVDGALWGQLTESSFAPRDVTDDAEGFALPGPVAHTVALPDSQIFVLEDGRIFFSGAGSANSTVQSPFPEWVEAHDVAVSSTRLYVSDVGSNAVLVIDRANNTLLGAVLADSPWLGQTTLFTHNGLLLAYDPLFGVLYAWDEPSEGLPEFRWQRHVGQCEASDFRAFYEGQPQGRARFLALDAELLLFCPVTPSGQPRLVRLSEMTADGLTEPEAVELPAGHYTSAIALEDTVVLTQFDNTRYRSRLVQVGLDSEVLAQSSEWSGRANSALVWESGLVVVDGDHGWLDFSGNLEPIGDTQAVVSP
jgi:hypothetical protein